MTGDDFWPLFRLQLPFALFLTCSTSRLEPSPLVPLRFCSIHIIHIVYVGYAYGHCFASFNKMWPLIRYNPGMQSSSSSAESYNADHINSFQCSVVESQRCSFLGRVICLFFGPWYNFSQNPFIFFIFQL